MKDNKYERLWLEEMKAHKLSIENNIELRGTIKKLVEANEQLVNIATPLVRDNDTLFNEVVRLRNLIKTRLWENIKNDK